MFFSNFILAVVRPYVLICTITDVTVLILTAHKFLLSYFGLFMTFLL